MVRKGIKGSGEGDEAVWACKGRATGTAATYTTYTTHAFPVEGTDTYALTHAAELRTTAILIPRRLDENQTAGQLCRAANQLLIPAWVGGRKCRPDQASDLRSCWSGGPAAAAPPSQACQCCGC
eukprot:scaffold369_cov18-Tisochrysis_lutea.AAC.4